MKKISLFLLTSLCFLTFINKVDAGVCKGKDRVSVDDYCDFGYGYNFKAYDRELNYHYYSVYTVSSGTISGKREYAFCLDPSKVAPGGNTFYHARELSSYLNGSADENIYRIYQQYVNAVASSGAAYNDEGKKPFLRNADSSLRYIISSNGWGQGYNYSYTKLKNAGAEDFYKTALSMRMWKIL